MGGTTTTTSGEQARAPSSRPRIVILEDDALVRTALVEALESAGYVTRAAERGAEVLDSLAEFAPDLIVLDMLLPEMDGFEFLARLRAHPERAHIPVLILSNLADSLLDCIDPDAAKAIGVEAILPKSMDLSFVLGRIGRLVGPERLSGAR